MPDDTDFYKILEIDKNASDDEIKKAFRRFSKKYHPDMQHGKSDAEKKDAEEMFKKGQAAYECLSDPEKRKIYDEYGIEGLQGHAQQGGFSGGMPDGLAEFLRRHMGGFGFGFNPFGDDMFGDGGSFNPFGHAETHKRKAPSNTDPEDGKSFRIRMDVNLEDVIFGTEKEFTMDGFDVCPECHGKKCESYEECPDCGGAGMKQRIQGNTIFQTTCGRCNGTGFSIKNPCSRCNGEGRVKVKRQIKVKIPKGMPEGGQLRVRGAGIPGLHGGQNGDLFIVINTKEHPLFIRTDDLDLKMYCFVNPLVSVFGGNVSIPTPHEMKTYYISAGTKNCQDIVLPGYGIRMDDGRKGDLTVTFLYDTVSPTQLSDSDKQKLRESFEIIDKNKDCLVNLRKQTKALNENTKLPWIVTI